MYGIPNTSIVQSGMQSQPNTVEEYQPHVKGAVGRQIRCHVTLHRERYNHVVGGMQCTLAQYNLLCIPSGRF
jgi:hypothetical protein